VYLAYFYRLGYMCVKNYQLWWKFDEVLTKTSWVIFWHTLYSHHVAISATLQSSKVRWWKVDDKLVLRRSFITWKPFQAPIYHPPTSYRQPLCRLLDENANSDASGRMNVCHGLSLPVSLVKLIAYW